MGTHSNECRCQKCKEKINELLKLVKVPPLRVSTRYIQFLLNVKEIRGRLLEYPEGASATNISKDTGLSRDSIQKAFPKIVGVEHKEYGGLWFVVPETGIGMIRVIKKKFLIGKPIMKQ